ncbi:MAG TPA: type I restriction endonuclease, partial [Firmicutes bacterium]|nr:type I restriction endonuclease [Bacillota bacterium]
MYDQFIEKASGSTVDNLNIEKVNSSLIPFPPLAEQQRIAERIE